MQPLEQPTQEQLAKRKANAERQRRRRAREKSRSVQAMEDHLERVRAKTMNEEGIARRTKRNECTFGETSPGVEARTVEEALEVPAKWPALLIAPTCKKANHFTTSNAVSSTPGQITKASVVQTTPLAVVERLISTDQPGNSHQAVENLTGKNTAVASKSVGRLCPVPTKSSTSGPYRG
jgi:hypothetical protein